jgi:hypothetical protein
VILLLRTRIRHLLRSRMSRNIWLEELSNSLR